MSRPYSKEQVFELEQKSEHLAMLIASAIGYSSIREMGYDTLEAILYDGMIALREQMLDEED